MPIIAAVAAIATATIDTMDTNASQPKNAPWPSLEVASWLFDKSSFLLIGSLAFGAIATFAIVWMGIVKERHWDILRESSNEKIAELNRDTSALKADAEASRAKIAEANARAVEARLALEKFKQPRSLEPEVRSRLLADLKAFAGTKFNLAVANDKESLGFGVLLADLLTEAGLKQIPWEGSDFVINVTGKPVIGVAVEKGVSSQFEPEMETQLFKPCKVLTDALVSAGLEARREYMTMKQPTAHDAMHLVVGTLCAT